MLLKGDATPTKHFKGKDFIELATGVQSINQSAGFRVLNTHLLPKYLPSKMLEQVQIHVIVIFTDAYVMI